MLTPLLRDMLLLLHITVSVALSCKWTALLTAEAPGGLSFGLCRELSLGSQFLGDTEITALVGALMASGSAVHTIHASFNKIGPRGGVALATLLNSTSHVKQLYLNMNKLGACGFTGKVNTDVILLCVCLLPVCVCSPHFPVVREVGPDGAIAIASVLDGRRDGVTEVAHTFSGLNHFSSAALCSPTRRTILLIAFLHIPHTGNTCVCLT